MIYLNILAATAGAIARVMLAGPIIAVVVVLTMCAIRAVQRLAGLLNRRVA